MKKIIFFAITRISFSQQINDEGNPDRKIIEVKTLERKITKPVNSFCPVEGKAVDANLPQLMYKDEIIGFCCEGCDEVFIKNPEFYQNKLIRKEK